ncbi:phosphate transporter (Pho88) [Cystobasidiomycetes sp. EMM_F5]
MAMNAQLLTLGLGVGLSQASKFLDLDRPSVLWPIRILYVAVQLFIIGFELRPDGLPIEQVRRKNDTTLLKYVEPKPFGGQTGEPPAVYTTTVRNYDLLEVSKALRGVFTGIAITGFMHLYLKFTQPLLVSSLTVWFSLIRANIVRLHLRGQEGAEDLKRPFKTGGFMAGTSPSTDKASIEAAERANLLYRKEEF